MEITVWDDHLDAADAWKEQIEGLVGDVAHVVAHGVEQIDRELEVLHERRRRYLGGDTGSEARDVSSLDQTDVLVVDNDLFELDKFVDLSAEMVAARSLVYTECRYVVVLNLSPDIDFDLSLLGHVGSKADLHINQQFVGNRGLWLECPLTDRSFRPWPWPLLLSAVSLQKARVDELRQYFVDGDRSVPLLDYFRFSETARRHLSRSAKAFLHPTKRAEEVSFLDFISGNVQAVDARDGAKVAETDDVDKIARICARRLSKWLSHLVAGPQDIIIDLPHLIAEFPFLVPEHRRPELEGWNAFAKLEGAPVEELTEDVSEFQFRGRHWFDRPVYWREKLCTEETVDRLLEVTRANGELPVFCEDASSFHPARECQRFVAGYHSASDTRFVRWFGSGAGGINYAPYSRLAT